MNPKRRANGAARERKATALRRAREWVRTERAAREELAEAARRKWRALGHRKRHAYLEHVREALEAEGFRSTRFQWRHRGHAYGLVKDLGDKQVHVRVYEDGVIDAEVEIHKRFLEHLVSPRPSAHRTVGRLLAKHGISTDLVNEHYLPQLGPMRRKYPGTRTKVSHALGVVGVAATVAIFSVARMMLKRKGRLA